MAVVCRSLKWQIINYNLFNYKLVDFIKLEVVRENLFYQSHKWIICAKAIYCKRYGDCKLVFCFLGEMQNFRFVVFEKNFSIF